MTDYVEEKEIDSEKSKQVRGLSTFVTLILGIRQAMSLIEPTIRKTDSEVERQREKELAKVSIKQVDVDVIIEELDVTREVAIHSLRANNGDLAAALSELINS